MDYPQDFPDESRARVEAARIRAGRRFDSKKARVEWSSENDALFLSYVLTPWLVFAEESSRLRLWPVDKMDEKCREFLRSQTIDAYYQKGRAAGVGDPVSNWTGGIRWEFQQNIEKTTYWRKFENIKLKLAEEAANARADRLTGLKQAQNSDSRSSSKAAQSTESKPMHRRATVDAYIEEVLSKTGKRITRKDIWTKTGYKTRTEFERWERQDLKHLNKSADERFTQILREKPHLK